MFIFIGIIVMGIWSLYNYATMIYPFLPYLDVYQGGNSLVETVHMVTVKWSPMLGVVFLLVGVLGLIFGKSDENNFSKLKYATFIFGFTVSVVLFL